jgi:NADPH-dependent ferric siderophore reductase
MSADNEVRDAPRPGRRPPLDSAALLKRLTGARLWQLAVTEARAITPSMRRLRFTAPDISEFRSQPGQDLMFSVPSERDRGVRRRYTIRKVDPAAGWLDVDIVLHGDGPGARWAATAEPGATVEAIGPRGNPVVDPAADWFLFAADESAVPATFAMVEGLPAGSRVLALVEVDGAEDEQPFEGRDGVDLMLRWLHRHPAAPGRSEALPDALSQLSLPDGRGQVFLNGELTVVNRLRGALVEGGLDAEQISAKPYWRIGAANAAHGEPDRV